jgi:hypothetical protein
MPHVMFHTGVVLKPTLGQTVERIAVNRTDEASVPNIVKLFLVLRSKIRKGINNDTERDIDQDYNEHDIVHRIEKQAPVRKGI